MNENTNRPRVFLTKCLNFTILYGSLNCGNICQEDRRISFLTFHGYPTPLRHTLSWRRQNCKVSTNLFPFLRSRNHLFVSQPYNLHTNVLAPLIKNGLIIHEHTATRCQGTAGIHLLYQRIFKNDFSSSRNALLREDEANTHKKDVIQEPDLLIQSGRKYGWDTG